MKYVVVFTFAILMMPVASKAAITINEIAWMGSTESANHEWIELYNDGGSRTVDGWVLSDSENLTIELTGTIAAGEHAVLERTSDDSAPGSAFLIYTGALKNSGATLILRRADNSIEDQVAGGENWENLGGDNVTKETAQYTVSGWITAQATPGAVNENAPAPDPDDDQDDVDTTDSGSNTQGTTNRSSGTVIELQLPPVTLQATIRSPDRVFVNQPVDFSFEADGIGDTLKGSLTYEWNFGDLHTGLGKEVTHTFSYPGTYVVYAQAEYARQHAATTKEITVLPIEMSITKNQSGDVQINNDSPYAIDISQYRLRAAQPVTLPDNTWLLANQTITVPGRMVGANENTLIGLYDTVGTLIASNMPAYLDRSTLASIEESTETVAAQFFAPVSDSRSVSYFEQVPSPVVPFVAAIGTEPVEQSNAADEVNVNVATDQMQGDQFLNADPSSRQDAPNWPVVGLIVLLSVGCIVLLLKPTAKKNSLNTYDD